MDEIADVFEISEDPVVAIYQNPLAIFWLRTKVAREDLEELIGNDAIKNEVVLSKTAGYISEHPEMIDPDQVVSFYIRSSRFGFDETCRRLLPAIQQYSLAPSIMRQLTNGGLQYTGILALSSLIEPPSLSFPNEFNDIWLMVAQIEYRRILWRLKNTDPDAKTSLQALFEKINLQILFETSFSADQLALVLVLWADLLLLGKKRFDPSPLTFSETEIDAAVRRTAHLKSRDLEAKLGLSIGKLLLANVLSPQAALRDLCALTGDFEEYQELIQLAINQCLVLGSQSLSSKLSLARGILQIRPVLGKPIVLGIKAALKNQSDDGALVLFLESLAKSAGSDLWSLINTNLLKDLSPEIRTKVLQTRPAGATSRKRSGHPDLQPKEPNNIREEASSSSTPLVSSSAEF